MQIAQIVPKVGTQDEGIFDYAIPPQLLPGIKPGLLVEIPFHGRKLEGIIIGLKSKSRISNLKSIIRIIDPMPVVEKTQIKLAQWMADYYLESLGKTLFEFIVPPAKRTIKKIKDSIIHAPAVKIEKSKSSKKYLIVSDFSIRLNFYLAAIKRTINRNQTVIILIPDLELLPIFIKYLKESIVVLHAGLTKTERWLRWHRIRENKAKIIIGSQSALFAPAKNLGLIIIDQEENETYKNDRSPRFHAVKVAEQLSKLTAANLVLGSVTPRVETYFSGLKGTVKIIQKVSKFHDRAKKTPQNTIVDMNFEKYVISNLLEKEIENTLNQKQKILLVLNRKGEGTKFACPDCNWIALCEKCGLPLIPQKTENVCFRCQKSYSPPETCPRCHSVHLKPMGLGTARLRKFLGDLFPEAKVIQVEKETDGRELRSKWDIAITTTYGLKFSWPKIKLVSIIDADQGLNFPDFSSPQKTFQNLYKFLRIGERGIIQTHLPENYVIKSLAQLNYEKFFLEELSQRQKYGFPPATRLVRLLLKDANKEEILKETSRIYKKISLLITNNRLPLTISPPHPCFIEKERGKFRYQIVLKIVNRQSSSGTPIPPDLKNLLRSLPKGWIIDIDPVNLL